MNVSSLLQEHVDGFNWPQLILSGAAGIAFVFAFVVFLYTVLFQQEDALVRGRSVVAAAAGLFLGSWLLITTPETFGFTVPTGVGAPVVVFAAILLIIALSTRRWYR